MLNQNAGYSVMTDRTETTVMIREGSQPCLIREA